jgi:FMN phosphatase YigB (HAD superfamily)
MAIKAIFFDLGNTLVTNSKTWFEGAKELLTALKSKGFHLGIISNTADLARPAIFDLLPPDFSLSDFNPQLVLLSSELGIAKPDPAIFLEAVRRADVPAAECLYCSENPVETQAAEQAAMLAMRVHFPPIVDLSTLRQRIEEISDGVNPI